MIQIFVNDEELDVSPDLVIAITLQAADIGNGDLVSRKASFTNQISVPKTSNNRTILGVSDDIHSTDTFPFVINGVRVLSNGIEILSGNCELANVADRFNLRIFSVIKDLSTTLGTAALDELDFGDSPITWDAAYWDGARASTSGLCAPVINYGQIDFSLADGSIGDFYLPSVSYKDILTQIMTEAGYTIVSGDFYDNDDFFNRMVMTYGRKIFPGTSFKINEILPDDVLQIDFVKDFLARFGAYFRFDGADVEIITLEDILNDTSNAVDWTDKRANKKFDLSFSWPDWARTNNFTYPDKSEPDIAEENNNGYVSMGNLNLGGERTVYNSLFHAHDSMVKLTSQGQSGVIRYKISSVSATILGATQPIWETIPSSYEFDNVPKPMLCLLRDADTFTSPDSPTGDITESTIEYNGTPRSDYKVAMFALPPYNVGGTQEYTPSLDSLRWRNNFGTNNGLLDIYYLTLEYILQTPKKVVRQYKLTDVDIFSLDLLVPIFDEGDYFLINKVNDYVPGRLTEVELLRIYYES